MNLTHEAIVQLGWTKPCSVTDGVINWHGEDGIPQKLIDAEVLRLQAEYDENEYQRKRASAYPSLEDQADMQYWDTVNGTTTWLDAIALVKATYPSS
jgi:hypothetical protein